MRGMPKTLTEFREFRVSNGSAELIGSIDTGERANSIDTFGESLRLVVGCLQVRIAEASFAYPVGRIRAAMCSAAIWPLASRKRRVPS